MNKKQVDVEDDSPDICRDIDPQHVPSKRKAGF